MNARFAILALSATLASTVSRPTSVSDRVSLDRRPRAIRVLVLTDMEGISGIDDPQADEVCKRLVDLAGKRAAVLDEAKTNLQAITPENSNYREVEVALDNYLAWWEARAEEIGLK